MSTVNSVLRVLRDRQNHSVDALSQILGVGTSTVTSAIRTLRTEGYVIYTNTTGYRLGKPSARYTRNMNAGRDQVAIRSLQVRGA